jgi:hypothetical protein
VLAWFDDAIAGRGQRHQIGLLRLPDIGNADRQCCPAMLPGNADRQC